jgi:dinuclear metal center YbgI/SA1388 family protein
LFLCLPMKIKEIISCLESFAPLSFQESYDNSGLITGDPGQDIKSVLLCIDITEEVINEAVKLGSGLIISHHPILFRPIRKLRGDNYVERCLIAAIRKNIALYAAHTNMDAIWMGVNRKICDKLGLMKTKILVPRQEELRKLVFFVPVDHAVRVREKVFEAGAGHIGNYDKCSFNTPGDGTFRGSDETHPFVGKKGQLHYEKEIRVETIYPVYRESNVIKALLEAHPYEEVAYDIYPLTNLYPQAGSGMTGEMPESVSEVIFLKNLKNIFRTKIIRHSELLNKKIRKVAVCGGSGSQYVEQAIRSGADIYITSDIRYHQFFDAEKKIIIADIGHYESEQYTTELFHELILKNFPKFAVHFSGINTNPVNYF